VGAFLKISFSLFYVGFASSFAILALWAALCELQMGL